MNRFIENETGTFEVTEDDKLVAFCGEERDYIKIPDGVKTIYKYCFTDCDILSQRYLFMPDSIIGIDPIGIASSKLKFIRVSPNLVYIGDTGIMAGNAKIHLPALGIGSFSPAGLDCSELEIGSFKFKRNIPSNVLNSYCFFTIPQLLKFNYDRLLFIASLDNLQEVLPYLDNNFHIFQYYQELIKICNEKKLYENQLLLTNYKHIHYPETIEETIKKKFEF